MARDDCTAEIDARTANTRKFAIMAVFPELRNGDTTPDSGSAPNTPALISIISKAIKLPRPKARKNPNCVSARTAARSAREIRNANSRNTAATPMKPHSSPMAGSTRSVLPAGIISGSPQPGPDPYGPPVENAQSACASWSPPCTSLSHGDSHISMRWTTVCGCPAR